jgi:undecaprenyl-phosphate 4-deoxy-4-formamido-L-arabinose transferase
MCPVDLSIVVPVYGSEDCLVALIDAIQASLRETRYSHEVVLVNDGSPDGSWRVIQRICEQHPNVVGVDLRRNFGQDNAIMTGLRIARGSIVAIMDDDLQHDPGYLPLLVEKIEAGFDVVYARFGAKHHALWKNLGSWLNGKLAEWVLEKPRGLYLSPYKAIRGALAREICDYAGPFPYVDGLLLQATSSIESIDVEHRERYAGTGHYGLMRSIQVWTRLAFSFSVLPLRLVAISGACLAGLAMLLVVATIVYRLASPEAFDEYAVGWASLIVVQLFVSGIQMIFFGIIGEYLGRSYLTLAHKPQAAIATVLNGEIPSSPSPGGAARS